MLNPLHRLEVIAGTQHEGIFAGPIEVLDLYRVVARDAAPRAAQVGAIAIGVPCGREQERVAHAQLGLDAALPGRELAAGEQVAAGAFLRRVLRSELKL